MEKMSFHGIFSITTIRFERLLALWISSNLSKIGLFLLMFYEVMVVLETYEHNICSTPQLKTWYKLNIGGWKNEGPYQGEDAFM